MFAIIMYDVEAKRTNKFKKLLRRYLQHTQYSVFCGDISESKLLALRKELSDLMNDEDRVVEILTANRHNIEISRLLKSTSGKGPLQRQAHNEHRQDFSVL
ncbi:CRISPR-associated endonuclease Cas2 [Thiorhodospira sibirica]|uniref:CRISPR-associated endonuclease Cas2 n=1 Tax=Thiorhodospira sibirica TaxID=154347 RepID=UPI00022C052E|nr:CRISPR-associated endonuclease Cas2 [Thiorhodospira sibirica]